MREEPISATNPRLHSHTRTCARSGLLTLHTQFTQRVQRYPYEGTKVPDQGTGTKRAQTKKWRLFSERSRPSSSSSVLSHHCFFHFISFLSLSQCCRSSQAWPGVSNVSLYVCCSTFAFLADSMCYVKMNSHPNLLTPTNLFLEYSATADDNNVPDFF